MKYALALMFIAACLSSAAFAADAIPPGCQKHPGKPGCEKFFPATPIPPPLIPLPPSPTVTLVTTTTNLATEVVNSITKLTTLTVAAKIPRGSIRVTTTIAAVRTSDDLGDIGETRATYMYLWKRSITPKPIGYSVTTCRSIGRGGILGRRWIQQCHAYYVMPRGKITASGIAHSPRDYYLVVSGGTNIYRHGAGIVHYRHGKLTISFK